MPNEPMTPESSGDIIRGSGREKEIGERNTGGSKLVVRSKHSHTHERIHIHTNGYTYYNL